MGWTSSSVSAVSWVGAPPPIGMMYRSQLPLRLEANATFDPSGAIDGMRSSLGSVVSWVTVRPSTDLR